MINLEKLKKPIALLCVVLLFFAAFFAADRVLRRKDSYEKLQPFYASPLTFDVLFFGTSHIYDGVSPLELWHRYGITSYNLGNNGLTASDSYWGLRRAIAEGRKPQAAVVDVFELKNDDGFFANKINTHAALDYFPADRLKWETVMDQFQEKQDRIELLFPFTLYHNRWKELMKWDFFPEGNAYLGFLPMWYVAQPAAEVIRTREDSAPINESQRIYLGRIAELCRAEGIQLLFINMPHSDHPEWQRRENGIYALAEELDVPYVNYMNEESALDFVTDFSDEGHLNVSGAHKLTADLGERLRAMGMKDHRGEQDTEAWNALYENYLAGLLDYMKESEIIKQHLMLLNIDAFRSEIRLSETIPIEEDAVCKRLLEQLSDRVSVTRTDNLSFAGESADMIITVRRQGSDEVLCESGFAYTVPSGIWRISAEG